MEVKGGMHVKQHRASAPPSNSILSLKLRKHFFVCTSHSHFTKREALWSDVATGNKDRWEGRGQC